MQGPSPEIEVTPEMLDALRACCEPLTSFGKWREPSLAPGGTNMWAEYLAEKQRVTELEGILDSWVKRAMTWNNRIAALEATKQTADELLTERNNLLEECIGYVERVSALEGRLTEAQGEAVRLRECISSRDAQIAALQGQDPAPAVLPDPIPSVLDDKPKPPKEHNPFRDFGGDPRRIGA
jgi:hypothetical protein